MARISMLFFAVAQPISFLVTLGYWILFGPKIVSGKTAFTYMNLFKHGLNTLLLLISFMISRMPYTFWHMGWLVVASMLYFTWTFLHFLLRLGNHGKACDADDPEDCPIYPQFDWKKPERTIILAAVGFVILPIIALLYIFLGFLRHRCAPKHEPVPVSENKGERRRSKVKEDDIEEIQNTNHLSQEVNV